MATLSLSSSLSDADLFQNSVYVGINIQNILYGIELLLYFKTIKILLVRDKAARKGSDIFYVLFSTVMVFLVTIWVTTRALFGEEMWLLKDDYRRGPDAYWEKNISNWYMDWGTTSIIALQLMTEGLMIYRCRIIYNSYRAIVVPVFLWLSTLTLGFFVDWTTSLPGGDFFTGVSSQLGLSYYTVSVFLNTTLTSMICYYMLRHGMRVRKGLGREYASAYFAVVTLVVESAIPYTLSGTAFLVSLGMGNSTSVAFVCVYILMMCISPQMLILRVLMGMAWDKYPSESSNSSLQFSPGRTSEFQYFDNSSSSSSNSELPPAHLQTLSNVYLPGGAARQYVDLASIDNAIEWYV